MKESTGESHPRVHSSWKHVFDILFARDEKTREMELQEFWSKAVDGSLFSSTHERKYLAFQLLEIVLDRAVDAKIHSAIFFSHNLMHCLLNSLSNPTTNLHNLANRIVSYPP